MDKILFVITDEEKANRLKAMGFQYMKERVDAQTTLYVFDKTDELESILKAEKYSIGKDYITSNTILF